MRTTREASKLISRVEGLIKNDNTALRKLIFDVKKYDKENPSIYPLANRIEAVYDIKIN